VTFSVCRKMHIIILPSILPSNEFFYSQNARKIYFSWGFVPDHTALPRLLLVTRGGIRRGLDEQEREEGEEKDGEYARKRGIGLILPCKHGFVLYVSNLAQVKSNRRHCCMLPIYTCWLPIGYTCFLSLNLPEWPILHVRQIKSSAGVNNSARTCK